MAPWGQETSAESRDVTHVLLSPRMGPLSANSPLNRKMPLSKEAGSRALFGLFQTDDCEGEENSVTGDDGNGDFYKLPSFKSSHVEQPGLLGEICKVFSVGLARQFSIGRKKSSKIPAFYIFASLAFMLLLVKISSLGWLGVQHSASPSKVHLTIYRMIHFICEIPAQCQCRGVLSINPNGCHFSYCWFWD